MLLTAIMAGSAYSQQLVDLFYYQAEQNYTTVGLPPGAMAITRFELEEAARLHEINVWLVNQEEVGDTIVVYLFGREGGGSYPLLLSPHVQFRAFVPGQFNNLVRFNFNEPYPTFVRPTNFFVGVQVLGPNVRVRMDNYTQTLTCATSRGDTIYTNSYWQPLDPPYIPFSSRFGSGMATNNWYIGTKVEFTFPSQTLFTDMTLMAGLNVPASGVRVSVADFDDDGYQDILYGQYLFRNEGNGRFTNVSAATGYDGGSTVNMFVDIDNDGDLDIVCQPATLVYINEGGVLTKDTEPGFGEGRNTQAMAFADYDGDNYPDFFVAHGNYMYVKNPQNPNDSALVRGVSWEAYFYSNTQNGKFRDIKGQVLGGYRSGPYGRNPYNIAQQIQGYRPITGVSWVDIDGDGDMDLYASVEGLQPNYMFENQGNGFFREVAMLHGLQGGIKTNPEYVGLFGNSRGCDFADYDNDGDPDLLVGERAEMWRLASGDLTSVWTNSGRPSSQFSQVPNATSKLGFNLYDGDVAWGDFDNDGLLDVLITSGEKCFNAVLYKQNPDRSFTNVTYEAGIKAPGGLGAVWFDYDNDGDLDLLIATETGLKLYRNDVGAANNWVAFNLRALNSNNYAIGARIKVVAGANTYTRWVTVGKGAGSQSPYVQHVGLGSATSIDSVIVRWPNGTELILKDVDINKLHNVIEQPPVSVEHIAAPVSIELRQNFPNPFSRSENALTHISYDVSAAADVVLRVYDTRGALVRTLVNGYTPAGSHVVSWDGSDERGLAVASGTYRYALTVNGKNSSRQMVVVK